MYYVQAIKAMTRCTLSQRFSEVKLVEQGDNKDAGYFVQ